MHLPLVAVDIVQLVNYYVLVVAVVNILNVQGVSEKN